ncbi:MAG: hypothetical protein K2Q97_13790 [Burkholderiaceae bacterium]|nr:hypothetical protein [Burkholderiaceae bacterium]
MLERPIPLAHSNGSTSAGRIDCCRRGHCVLEAKKLRAGSHTKSFGDGLLRARISAQVTRDVATLLAHLAKALEASHWRLGSAHEHWRAVLGVLYRPQMPRHTKGRIIFLLRFL